MRIALVWSTLTVGVALAGCAVEPGGPSPYGYAEIPYYGPGGPAYWSSPYYAPYAPYGYAGSTLGFGFDSERWHGRDRDWHHHDRDRDWHREGGGEDHHHAERSAPGSVAAAPPVHASPPPTHAAPTHPAPPSGRSAPPENPARTFHSPF